MNENKPFVEPVSEYATPKYRVYRELGRLNAVFARLKNTIVQIGIFLYTADFISLASPVGIIVFAAFFAMGASSALSCFTVQASVTPRNCSLDLFRN